MDVQVNLLGVLLAAIGAMVVGATWYSNSVFGRLWRKLARIEGDGGTVLRPIAVALLMNLLTAYILAHVSYLSNQFFHHSYLQDAVTTAFWAWLGFVAARLVIFDGFESRPNKLTLINASSELVTFLLMGIIIGLIGT